MFKLLKSFFPKKPPFEVGDKIKFVLGTPIYGFKIDGVYTVRSLSLGKYGEWFVRVNEVPGSITFCSDFRLAEE